MVLVFQIKCARAQPLSSQCLARKVVDMEQSKKWIMGNAFQLVSAKPAGLCHGEREGLKIQKHPNKVSISI